MNDRDANGRNQKLPEFEQVTLAATIKLRELCQAMSIAVVIAIEEDVSTYAYDFAENYRVVCDITQRVKRWREKLVEDVEDARERRRQEEERRRQEAEDELAIA